MKALFSVMLVLFAVRVHAQDRSVMFEGDSLIVRDFNMVADPFRFEPDPLKFLSSEINSSKPVIVKSTVENLHVIDQVDTTYSIAFGKDAFKIYRWRVDKNALLYAEIWTANFETKHGIKVGMNKSQIAEALNELKLTGIPKYVILESTDVPEYLKLEFNGDILKKIEFHGYID